MFSLLFHEAILCFPSERLGTFGLVKVFFDFSVENAISTGYLVRYVSDKIYLNGHSTRNPIGHLIPVKCPMWKTIGHYISRGAS